MRIASCLFVAIAALPTPVQAASHYYSDQHFIDFATGYTTTLFAPDGYTVSAERISESNGPFNFAIDVRYERTGPNPSSVRMWTFNESYVYDPSLQGIIDTIDFTLSQRAAIRSEGGDVSLAGAPSYSSVLARQGGRIYRAARAGPAFRDGFTYVTDYRTGLTAADFRLFDPANPAAGSEERGLDFAGGAITFGFELALFGTVRADGTPVTGHTVASYRADDFFMAVHAQDPALPPDPQPAVVPEPGIWLTMIAGFGLVGATIRRQARPGRPSGRIADARTC